MIQEYRSSVTDFLVLLIIGWMSASSVYDFLSDHRPPLVIHSGVANPSQIKVEEPLKIDGEVTRYSTCPIESHRYVRRLDGTVVFRDTKPLAAREVGRQKIRVYISLPRLEPGQYVYETIAYTDCGRKIYSTRGREIPFEVIE